MRETSRSTATARKRGCMMKKDRKPQKLTLSRETLCHLEKQALREAAGGVRSHISCDIYTCWNTCPTFVNC
jgi:hypothetical protein